MNELTEAELSVLVEALTVLCKKLELEMTPTNAERWDIADRLFDKAYDLLKAHHRYTNTI